MTILIKMKTVVMTRNKRRQKMLRIELGHIITYPTGEANASELSAEVTTPLSPPKTADTSSSFNFPEADETECEANVKIPEEAERKETVVVEVELCITPSQSGALFIYHFLVFTGPFTAFTNILFLLRKITFEMQISPNCLSVFPCRIPQRVTSQNFRSDFHCVNSSAGS